MQRLSLILLFSLLLALQTKAADDAIPNRKGSAYRFSILKEVARTSVKNQMQSGTCWCFSSNSFLESELMRMGKDSVDLSEMYPVHNMYLQKAKLYLRYGGNISFGEGGEFHDVMNSLRQYGLMPQTTYSGLPEGENKIVMSEVNAVLKAMLDAQLQYKSGKLNPNGFKAYEAALNAYMGEPPAQFIYDGKTVTPKDFAKNLGLNADDYVYVTSFTHHPFYQPFILEVPDNWANQSMYNVTLDDLLRIAENAIDKGYSLAWAADVSEKGFSFKDALAIVPEKEYADMTQLEKDSLFFKVQGEKNVTQDLRQQAFDNLSTTDDHGMHITGLAQDQSGKKFFIVKNSWGSTGNDCGGYFFCSSNYFAYKTTSIMLHKDAIPADIRKKLGI